MKLVKQMIAKDGSGTVTLLPEEPEDMVCYLHSPSRDQPYSMLILHTVAFL
jgi:hypothetical protein